METRPVTRSRRNVLTESNGKEIVNGDSLMSKEVPEKNNGSENDLQLPSVNEMLSKKVNDEDVGSPARVMRNRRSISICDVPPDSPSRNLRKRTVSPEVAKNASLLKNSESVNDKRVLMTPTKRLLKRNESTLATVDSPKPRKNRLSSGDSKTSETNSDSLNLRRSRRLSTELNVVEEDPINEDIVETNAGIIPKSRRGKRLSVLPSQPSLPEEVEENNIESKEVDINIENEIAEVQRIDWMKMIDEDVIEKEDSKSLNSSVGSKKDQKDEIVINKSNVDALDEIRIEEIKKNDSSKSIEDDAAEKNNSNTSNSRIVSPKVQNEDNVLNRSLSIDLSKGNECLGSPITLKSQGNQANLSNSQEEIDSEMAVETSLNNSHSRLKNKSLNDEINISLKVSGNTVDLENNSIKDTSMKNTSMKNTSMKNTSMKNTSMKDTSMKTNGNSSFNKSNSIKDIDVTMKSNRSSQEKMNGDSSFNKSNSIKDVDVTMKSNRSSQEKSATDKLSSSSSGIFMNLFLEDTSSCSPKNISSKKNNSRRLSAKDIFIEENKSIVLDIVDDNAKNFDDMKSPNKSDRGSRNNSIVETDETKNCILRNLSTSTPLVTNKSKKDISHNSSKSSRKSLVINVEESDKDDDNIEDEDEEESASEDETKIAFLDTEAEVVDDYCSGDSMSDSERLEIEENEIIERGESLQTEEDDDDDDDDDDDSYEKDSFICTSDDEDDILLSGTGDDLSSGEELTQSLKSKAKYNEKQKKIQKRASREMFNSRHGNTEKGKSPNASGKNVFKIESESESESENAKRGNNKKGKSPIASVKNVRKIESESESDVSVVDKVDDEKEITNMELDVSGNDHVKDPLAMSLIKQNKSKESLLIEENEVTSESSSDDEDMHIKNLYDEELRRLHGIEFASDDSLDKSGKSPKKTRVSDQNRSVEKEKVSNEKIIENANKLPKNRSSISKLNKSYNAFESRKKLDKLSNSLNLPDMVDQSVPEVPSATMEDTIHRLRKMNESVERVFTSLMNTMDIVKCSVDAGIMNSSVEASASTVLPVQDVVDEIVEEIPSTGTKRKHEPCDAASEELPKKKLCTSNDIESLNLKKELPKKQIVNTLKISDKSKAIKRRRDMVPDMKISNAVKKLSLVNADIDFGNVVATSNFEVQSVNASKKITWTSTAGQFSVKPIERIIPTDSTTAFKVVSLKKHPKQAIKVDAKYSSDFANFKKDMLYNRNIRREPSSNLKKQTQKLNIQKKAINLR